MVEEEGQIKLPPTVPPENNKSSALDDTSHEVYKLPGVAWVEAMVGCRLSATGVRKHGGLSHPMGTVQDPFKQLDTDQKKHKTAM